MPATLILQTYLDEVAAAVMADDWPAYEGRVSLPCHLVTHEVNITITEPQRLRQGYEEFRDTLRSQRVTDYIRLVESAVLLDKDLLAGRYITHLMAGSLRLLDPFPSAITLRHSAGQWRAVSISNAIANSRWSRLVPVQAFQSPEEGQR